MILSTLATEMPKRVKNSLLFLWYINYRFSTLARLGRIGMGCYHIILLGHEPFFIFYDIVNIGSVPIAVSDVKRGMKQHLLPGNGPFLFCGIFIIDSIPMVVSDVKNRKTNIFCQGMNLYYFLWYINYRFRILNRLGR